MDLKSNARRHALCLIWLDCGLKTAWWSAANPAFVLLLRFNFGFDRGNLRQSGRMYWDRIETGGNVNLKFGSCVCRVGQDGGRERWTEIKFACR